jgi:hypothetical protein
VLFMCLMSLTRSSAYAVIEFLCMGWLFLLVVELAYVLRQQSQFSHERGSPGSCLDLCTPKYSKNNEQALPQ